MNDTLVSPGDHLWLHSVDYEAFEAYVNINNNGSEASRRRVREGYSDNAVNGGRDDDESLQ